MASVDDAHTSVRPQQQLIRTPDNSVKAILELSSRVWPPLLLPMLLPPTCRAVMSMRDTLLL